MSAITPSTELYLLKCPLEIDNQNQLDFATKSAQETYFKSLDHIFVEEYTYQRKDSVIRVNFHIDSILEYNYVMYKNENYTDKWFYAFITGMEYVNDNCTLVSIKTDVWQTWQFDLTWKRCFVEREHVNDDTFGKHTLDEGFPTGEYVVNGFDEFGFSNPQNFAIVVQVSDFPSDMVAAASQSFRESVRVYGGLPSGTWNIILPWRPTYTKYSLYQSLYHLVSWWDEDGKADAIIAMYTIPSSLIPEGAQLVEYVSSDGENGFDGYFLPTTDAPFDMGNHNWSRNTTLDGYTPHNKKVLCFPFNYLMMTNNGGTDVVYHWEEFSTSNANFQLDAIVNQGCDMKLRPTNYKRTNTSGGYEWSVSGQKLPVVSWHSDYYLNWQARNGVNAYAKSGGKLAASFNDKDANLLDYFGNLFQNIGATVATGFRTITNNISGADRDAQITPDESKGNLNTGDINFTLGKMCFTGYKMSLRKENAIVIDQYFDRYGYKINENKIPNIKGRQNWNFIKLSDVNVIADIPQKDLDEIKMYAKQGITFWHNPSTFMDYSQSNSIVS